MTDTSFKGQHLEFQHLVRELLLLRQHNFRCAEERTYDQLLHFAEGALVLIALERFVRIVLGSDASESDTIYNLLEEAVSRQLLILPWDDQADGIRKVKDVRNSLLHGNYEQAAREAECASVEEFFRLSRFISEVEALTGVLNHFVQQIDPNTGQRR
jgi:hypothetical protein